MTTQANSRTAVNAADESQVVDYLRNTPEFFERNAELLSELQLPHPSGGAISLVERQVQVLREQNAELKAKLMDLVEVARDNDRLNERMHRLTLDLLRDDGLAPLLDTLGEHLRGEFNADAVAIRLAGIDDSRARELGVQRLETDVALDDLFGAVFASGRPICGRLKQDQLEFLFEDRAAAIESAAVVPLGDKAAVGVLAIGSCESIRFHPGMGTLFLSHLGELVGQVLSASD